MLDCLNLREEYKNLFTPIDFELTEIIEVSGTSGTSNMIKEIEAREKEEKENLEIYHSKILPKSNSIGLKNPENNCYMNSILQVLVNQPLFYFNMLEASDKSKIDESLGFSILDFFRKYLGLCFSDKIKSITPKSLLLNLD